MKILYVLSQQPGNTGSGIYLKWLTYEAVKNGHDIKVVIGVNKNFNYLKELPHINENNIFPVYFNTKELPFYVPGMSDTMPYRSTKFRDMNDEMLEKYKSAFLKVFEKIREKWVPDVIHSNHLWIVSSLLKDVFKDVPVFVSCHGTELRQRIFCKRIAESIEKKLKDVDGIFALTEFQKKEIVKWLKIEEKKIFVTGAAYPDTIFYCKNRRLNSNEFVISYAGKISYAKGVPYLIEAFKRLDSKDKNLKLFLAGGYDNIEGKEIINLAKGEKNIIFLGNISQKDLAELFRNSDLFILPSFFEGLPLVVIEALACGCNVIVTELDSVKNWFDYELIKSEIVKFIPLPQLKDVDKPLKKDEEKFINDIYTVLKDCVKKEKVNLVEKTKKFVERFSYKNLFKRIEEIYFFTLDNEK